MVKALLLLLVATALSGCGDARLATVQVANPWAQPVDAAGTAVAVYMTITDFCTRPEKLLAVAATLPRKASLHTSRVVDNTLSMTPLASVPINCAGPTSLKPMGAHVMVTGIEKPLEIGDRIPLTLTFDQSGDVNVVAEVTTLAVLENVDPMHMHMHMQPGHAGMQGMH